MWIHPRPTGGRGRGPRGARSRAVYRADEHVEGVQEAGRKTWKGTKEGHVLTLYSLYVCSLIDASRNVQGREEVCSRNVSAGVDRKANSRPVRATGGLLQGLQRRVALEALREISCSFGIE